MSLQIKPMFISKGTAVLVYFRDEKKIIPIHTTRDLNFGEDIVRYVPLIPYAATIKTEFNTIRDRLGGGIEFFVPNHPLFGKYLIVMPPCQYIHYSYK